MNWYELATTQEVEEVLSTIYREKWDSEVEWISTFENHALHSRYKNSVNFEIAEQLWSNYDGI